jgi:ketosteroid isomerase-like protein
VSNAERVTEFFAPIFGAGETVMDEELIERMVEAARPLISEDFVVVMVGAEGFQGSFEGADGFRQAWADWLEAFERVAFEIESVEEVGENVLTLARQVGVTRHGGIEIEQPSAAVWKFRDGVVHRIEFHLDREQAIRSAQGGAP